MTNRTMKRRGFLVSLAGVVLAGCTGSAPRDTESGENETTEEVNTSSDEPETESEPEPVTDTLQMEIVDEEGIPQEGVRVYGKDHISQDVLFMAPPTDAEGLTEVEVESGKPYYLDPRRGDTRYYFNIEEAEPESAKIEPQNESMSTHQIRVNEETWALIELRGSPYGGEED